MTLFTDATVFSVSCVNFRSFNTTVLIRHQGDQWLNGTPEQAEQLIQVPALELFNAGPAHAAPPALF
jgi:hypothetical protein